ncbi:MAG: hypothetical protein JOY59_13435 [Candidatus Eremiobacteraeota bacterium]|nr:hypothetical protein [Candidatus Eremiobacteraeota bacterium]
MPTAAAPTAAVPPEQAQAVALVRRYLDAVQRGDTSAAYSALGSSAGAGGASLSEQAIMDPTARITGISARDSGPFTTHVEADLTNARGQYFLTFDVRQTAGGPVIANHGYIPVGGTTSR